MQRMCLFLQAVSSATFCGLLAGCAMQTTAVPTGQQGAAMQGKVHGGQQAVVGAHVHLMAAGTSGTGGASTSLLTLNTAGSDSYGGYVTTDSNGFFTITADYACTPGQQAYVLATGGNPGLSAGQTNPNLALIAAIGQCPVTGTYATSVSLIDTSEVSTAASVYALAGFMTDLSHVSSTGSTLSNQGLANAFTTAQNLYNVGTGQALAVTPSGNGTVPQAEINTLANIIAPCVNSKGNAGTDCPSLFSNAQNSAGGSPTDTTTALVNIAHHPAVNVANLFGLQASNAPFQPSLSSAPSDFTLCLSFTGGGIYEPVSLALDGSGNPWVVNSNSSISELNGSTGAALSPAGGFTGNGLDTSSYSIAIDRSGEPWVLNSSSVSRFTASGAAFSGSPYTGGGLYNPPNYGFLSTRNIAFDASGNAWIPDYYMAKLTELNGITGASMSGANGFPVGAQTSNVPQGRGGRLRRPRVDRGRQWSGDLRSCRKRR